jgi:hypothetical protein
MITKNSTYFGGSYEWIVGLRKGGNAHDDTAGAEWRDETPSPATGNLYYTDASGTDLKLSEPIAVGDFIYGEKQFTVSLGCSFGGNVSSSVSIPLWQRFAAKKVASGPSVSTAFQGIENLIGVGTRDVKISVDKVRSMVKDKKDIKIPPALNPQ